MICFGDSEFFKTFSDTSSTLFSLLYGDSVYYFFNSLTIRSSPGYTFAANLYIYSFLLFFTTSVFNVFIAIICMAYDSALIATKQATIFPVSLGIYGIVSLGTCGIVSLGIYGIVSLGIYGIVSLGTCGIVSLGICGIVYLGTCGIVSLGIYGIVSLGTCGIVSLGIYGIVSLGICGIVSLGTCGIVSLGICGVVSLGICGTVYISIPRIYIILYPGSFSFYTPDLC